MRARLIRCADTRPSLSPLPSGLSLLSVAFHLSPLTSSAPAVINATLTALFGAEVLVKLMGMTWDFFSDRFNIFDFVVALLSALQYGPLPSLGIRSLRAARTIRVLRGLRVLRMVRFFQ